MIPVELMHSIDHGDDIFNRRPCLDVVDCVEHEAAPGREDRTSA